MKVLTTTLTTIFCLLASTAAYAGEPTHFTCGSMGHGDVLNIQFDGSRYADSVQLQLTPDELKQLLLPQEKQTKTFEQRLGVSLQVGACKRHLSGDVLVSCSLKPDAWSILTYSFGKIENVTDGLNQVVRVDRETQAKALELKVEKAGQLASLSLEMTIENGTGNDSKLRIERTLATLEHDWYMCKFE